MATKLTAEKKEIIGNLIEAYDIKTTKDIQEALKDLLGGTIQEMLESELEDQIGHERYESTEEAKTNYRNGHKTKQLKTSMGAMEIEVPQDRNSEFEPIIVPKYKRDVSEIEEKIINMYARGQSTREISEQIEDIYGFEASAELVSRVTDRIVPEIEEWRQRRLAEVYPIIFIDCIMFSVRKEKTVQKMAAYIVMGVSGDGMKEVLSIEIGETESSRYWLGVLNGLKGRGVRDIMVICADGLTGIKEAIEAAYPNTEYQHCIVHMVRNTLRHVSDKDKKAYAGDLKGIYQAADEEGGLKAMKEAQAKWEAKYPRSMNRWEERWAEICPIFKYSAEVRKALYTTNAIESLNSQYRRINSKRGVFPGEDSLMKAMYLTTVQITKKWTNKVRDWGKVYGEMSILFPGRLS